MINPNSAENRSASKPHWYNPEQKASCGCSSIALEIRACFIDAGENVVCMFIYACFIDRKTPLKNKVFLPLFEFFVHFFYHLNPHMVDKNRAYECARAPKFRLWVHASKRTHFKAHNISLTHFSATTRCLFGSIIQKNLFLKIDKLFTFDSPNQQNSLFRASEKIFFSNHVMNET